MFCRLDTLLTHCLKRWNCCKGDFSTIHSDDLWFLMVLLLPGCLQTCNSIKQCLHTEVHITHANLSGGATHPAVYASAAAVKSGAQHQSFND